nr:Gag-Pol polyprotein [Tanacetum cinerariifolium]GEZ10912.1 Gag-Pol polyprotein [Tanacetum cinerariifolium]
MANLSHYGSDVLAEVFVQNSNSSAQQDELILYVIDQLKTQVINCTKINLDNKSVNDTLAAELEIYKEQVKVLKEGQNVEEKRRDNFLDSHKQNAKIHPLKQTLSEQLQEKESLMKTVTKAQQLEPKLYDGNVIMNTYAITIPDSKKTLTLAEEGRSKMILKQHDPMVLEKKVNTTPNSMNSLDPSPSCTPTRVKVPKELPKVSMVNMSLKKLKHHLDGFELVVKERTMTTAFTEGSWSFDLPSPEFIALIAEVVAPDTAASIGSPSSTIVDQDAPSPSNSQTSPETRSSVISNDVEEANHELDVEHINNDLFFGISIPKNVSEASSLDVIPTVEHTASPNSEHVNKWTKDHPLDNIIVEPKTYKDALTQSCWIEAMQEELNEFERLEVWELIPRPDKVMVITLK